MIIEGEFQEDIVEERRPPAAELASVAPVPVDDQTAAAAANPNGLVGAAPATVAALPDIADDKPVPPGDVIPRRLVTPAAPVTKDGG
jgi:hypothetical protein